MDCANLVKKATSPPKDGGSVEAVSLEYLNPIKQLCKTHPESIKELFYYLSLDLTKRNGVVRLRVLFIMDHLLHRSKEFRTLVFSDIRQISKCMGLLTDQASSNDRSVPNVTSHSMELQNKGKEFIEIWDHLYGDRNPQLRAIARYFRESLRLQMPNIMENAAQHAERAERNRQHSRNVVLLQRAKLLEGEWMASMNEWKTSVSRLEECFNILFPRFSDCTTEVPGNTSAASSGTGTAVEATTAEQDDVNWEDWDADEVPATEHDDVESAPDPAREQDHESTTVGAPYTLTIRLATTAADIETRDNAILVHHIREISRQLARAAVPKLLGWQDLFSQAAGICMERVTALRQQSVNDGATSASAESSMLDIDISASSPTTSTLGKRSADALSSAAAGPSSRSGTSAVMAPSPHSSAELEKWEAEKCSVDAQLVEMSSLLGEIRSLLTCKCKTLLQNESI